MSLKTKIMKEEIKIMDAMLTLLNAKIADIHSEAEIESDVTASVQAEVATAVNNAVAPFQQQVTDLETTLTNMVTALSAPSPNAADVANAASQAVAASQAATTANVAAVGAGTAPTA